MILLLDLPLSLPIFSFPTITTRSPGLFRGSALGLTAASVFATCTSQVRNRAFSFDSSLTSHARALNEAAAQRRLSSWQKFCKLREPFATPTLLRNSMVSGSGGWYFVLASEVPRVVGRPMPGRSWASGPVRENVHV